MNEATEPKKRRWFQMSKKTDSMILLCMNVLGLSYFLFCTTVVSDKFEMIHDDLLDSPPAGLTGVIFSIPDPIYIFFFGCAIIALILKERFIKNKKQTCNINVVVMITGIILFMLFVVAMMRPLMCCPHSGLS